MLLDVLTSLKLFADLGNADPDGFCGCLFGSAFCTPSLIFQNTQKIPQGQRKWGRDMNVAFGMKAHSGWAALVVIGKRDGDLVVADRRRIELVDEEWAKQPYHAAEDLQPEAARDLVKRGIEEARRIAVREVMAAVKRERERDNEVAGCAVLVVDPLPGWSVDEILAVHFRMHKAEGVLFRDALVLAAKSCELRLVEIHEKLLMPQAEEALGKQASSLAQEIARLGKAAGPPWGKDQKDAALAALVALR
jgi:hypothetical protein